MTKPTHTEGATPPRVLTNAELDQVGGGQPSFIFMMNEDGGQPETIIVGEPRIPLVVVSPGEGAVATPPRRP